MTRRHFFFQRLAQTSPAPPALEVVRAKGAYLFGPGKKKYLDLISGISVSNLGHAHPAINKAIRKQLDQHSYIMVYGEYILSPQVEYGRLLTDHLPRQLNSVYFVNSGSEAIEGALKLAKRFTGRTEIVSFKRSYHGSTHGALSIIGDEKMKQAFRPLLPDITQLTYNDVSQLDRITERTACVVAEPIQAEAGVIEPTRYAKKNFLSLLKERCEKTGTLLILDEIQTGMKRTGTMFAFEKQGIVPDILCLGKALGGGMPLGAFVSSKKIMDSLSHDPVLGHITTFGGHPLSCAAGAAAFRHLMKIPSKDILRKGRLFKELLRHPRIQEVRGEGLLLAVQFASEKENKEVIQRCMDAGVLVDWFLFNPSAMRIAPPLIISDNEMKSAVKIILSCLSK